MKVIATETREVYENASINLDMQSLLQITFNNSGFVAVPVIMKTLWWYWYPTISNGRNPQIPSVPGRMYIYRYFSLISALKETKRKDLKSHCRASMISWSMSKGIFDMKSIFAHSEESRPTRIFKTEVMTVILEKAIWIWIIWGGTEGSPTGTQRSKNLSLGKDIWTSTHTYFRKNINFP